MTSTTDTAGHPEVAEISDLTEGLLPPSRTADVRQHLDECPLCADVRASLEEIRGMLGTLPRPPRMPDDVAGRIDAALAAEALLDATAHDLDSAEVPPGSRGTVSDDHDAVRVSRETPPAVDRPAGHSRGSTRPGRQSAKRRTRRTTVLAGVFTVAALGLGTLLVQSMSDTGSGGTPPQSEASATFSGVKLEKQVTDLLDGAQSPSSPDRDSLGIETEPSAPESPTKNTTTVFKTDVPVCIAKGIGDASGAIASKQGTYEGADAYLVVLPDSADTARVTAYVVDASCMEKTPEPTGEVLLKQTYPRP
ncbi:anti-sigma factor [Streptomyces sp. TG1A-60]|uniref:anti-sigma factor family protein n=1 Tax=Streptomyces sp. TG1A-60 TaxID=3129111 RepID=UPI0030CEDBC3